MATLAPTAALRGTPQFRPGTGMGAVLSAQTPQAAMQALGPAYQSSYNSALDYNTALGQQIDQGYRNLLSWGQAANENIGRGYEGVAGQLGTGLSAAGDTYRDRTNQVAGGYDVQAGDIISRATHLGQQQGVGYGNLDTRIQNTLRGAETSRMNDLSDQYAMESGRLAQQMVNSGLGNSTVQGSMQRGLLSRLSQEQTRVSNEFAGTRAGYQADVGLAGLGAERQVGLAGLDMFQRGGLAGLNYRGQREADLLQQQNRAIEQPTNVRLQGLGHEASSVGQALQGGMGHLGYMNSISAPYPEAGMYAQLAQQFGAQQQMQGDRQLVMDQIRQTQQSGGAGVMPSGGGYARSSGGGFSPLSTGTGGPPLQGTSAMPAPYQAGMNSRVGGMGGSMPTFQGPVADVGMGIGADAIQGAAGYGDASGIFGGSFGGGDWGGADLASYEAAGALAGGWASMGDYGTGDF